MLIYSDPREFSRTRRRGPAFSLSSPSALSVPVSVSLVLCRLFWCPRHLPVLSWFRSSVAPRVFPAGRVGTDSGPGARCNPEGSVRLSPFRERPPNCISETCWGAVDKTQPCVPDASLCLRVRLHAFVQFLYQDTHRVRFI